MFGMFSNQKCTCALPNTPKYVGIDQGICKVKLKVAQNEKWKKLRGFSFSINIANFEAFLIED